MAKFYSGEVYKPLGETKEEDGVIKISAMKTDGSQVWLIEEDGVVTGVEEYED